MTTKPLPGQLDLFSPTPRTADEAQSAARRRSEKGGPRQWLDRIEQGMCGVCGMKGRETQPDAHKTILQSTSDQYCRDCFQAAVQGLAERGITRATTQEEKMVGPQFSCGHCGEIDAVERPLWSRASDPPSQNDLVMAGARYCGRCRKVLCNACGDKDYRAINADCARKDSDLEPMKSEERA